MDIIPQLVWRWKIAAYLFLAGAGAGAYLVGAVAMFAGYEVPAKIAVTVGVPVIAISTLFLLADLGHPEKMFKAMMNPGTSWISRGFFILWTVLILGGLHVALWVWPFAFLNPGPQVLAALAVIAGIFAIATALYTGLLIGVVVSRPFWNNALLPVLFLVSAISTGIGLVLFSSQIWFAIAGITQPGRVEAFLTQVTQLDAILILIEALIVYLYLQIVSERAPQAVAMLVKGRFSGVFWGGFIVIGLLVPLIIEYFALTAAPDLATELLMSFIAGILVLFGGLLLRFLVLAAGIRTPLYVRVAFNIRPGQ